MFKSLDIQKDMEVVGLDGKHVGTVDHLDYVRVGSSKPDALLADRMRRGDGPTMVPASSKITQSLLPILSE